jgi:hypothetical protein
MDKNSEKGSLKIKNLIPIMGLSNIIKDLDMAF